MNQGELPAVERTVGVRLRHGKQTRLPRFAGGIYPGLVVSSKSCGHHTLSPRENAVRSIFEWPRPIIGARDLDNSLEYVKVVDLQFKLWIQGITSWRQCDSSCCN